MTNAVGYAHNIREELFGGPFSFNSKSFDINRDFPYNQLENSQCMNTIASRVVYKLFQSNIFVSAITFHGGTNVISYPWGSKNHLEINDRHRAAEAPDFVAFDTIG